MQTKTIKASELAPGMMAAFGFYGPISKITAVRQNNTRTGVIVETADRDYPLYFRNNAKIEIGAF
jgi:hypothetical protein